MTDHDEDQGAEQGRPGEILIRRDEALAAYAAISGPTNRTGVADLLRAIILADRSTRVAIIPEDPRRQYATLAEFEAAIAGRGDQRPAAAPAARHVCVGAACWGDPDCPVYSTRLRPAGGAQ